MRLYLLPISRRRTLLYAERLNITTTTQNASYADKAVNFAARKWAEWEKKDAGWQRKVVDYGNQAMRRIPYEEWGLKSVPPLSARRRDEELKGKEKVQLVFPRAVIPVHKAEGIVRALATEREALHRKRMVWCVLGMPLTIPVGLLPVIPNLPFFYLVFRAWSHWRAIRGGQHVQWLVNKQLLLDSPSEKLDKLYGKNPPPIDDTPDGKDEMLLTQKDVQSFTDTLEIPALSIELERAIWQVETAIEKTEAEAKAGKAQETVTTTATSETTKDEKKDQ